MPDLIDAMNEPHVFQDSTWFCGDGRSDWMGRIFKFDGAWCAVYRFRYYKDAKAFGSTDEKQWYSVQGPDDSAETLAALRGSFATLAPLLELKFGTPVDVVELQCFNDDAKFMFEIGSRPWSHMRLANEQEAEEYFRTGKLPD